MFATLLAMPARRLASVVALTVTTLLAATPSASAAPVPLPRPDHVLVVVMENKDPGEIIGNAAAPYLTGLARAGASFTDAHAETHPSQPNYLALFSGSTQGVTDNGCDHRLTAPNLGSALLASGRTFVGYSEGLPQAGSTVCTAGRYARKHSPWVNFTDLNPIATVLAGPMVTPGRYPGRIDHYSLLRTIEDMYGLSPLGASADRNPITDIWRTALTTAPEAPAGRR